MRPSVVLRTTGLTVSDRRSPTIAAKRNVSCVIANIDVIVKRKDYVVLYEVRRVCLCADMCECGCGVQCTLTVTNKT